MTTMSVHQEMKLTRGSGRTKCFARRLPRKSHRSTPGRLVCVKSLRGWSKRSFSVEGDGRWTHLSSEGRVVCAYARRLPLKCLSRGRGTDVHRQLGRWNTTWTVFGIAREAPGSATELKATNLLCGGERFEPQRVRVLPYDSRRSVYPTCEQKSEGTHTRPSSDPPQHSTQRDAIL